MNEQKATTLLERLNILPHKILPKTTPETVYVMVESYEDIGFWKPVFQSYQNEKLRFEIKPCTRNDKANHGKSEALKRANQATKNYIVCIDSDYDYLLQNETKQSKKVNNGEFIFQTYAYAIENLRCYSPSLQTLCVVATNNDKELLDIENLLGLYSETVAPLFLWSIWLTKEKKADKHFSITDFCKIIAIEPKEESESFDNFYENRLTNLQENVDKKLNDLENNFPNEKENIAQYAKYLSTLGWKANETYLFVKGHTILPEVVRHFLTAICNELISQRKYEINTRKRDTKERKDADTRHYEKSLADITISLNQNTEFKNCAVFQHDERRLGFGGNHGFDGRHSSFQGCDVAAVFLRLARHSGVGRKIQRHVKAFDEGQIGHVH